MSIFKCKMCGGSLEIPEGSPIAYCQYCGTKLEFDNGNKTTTHNYNHTYVQRDEARIRETERKEKIRLKELENQENQKKREQKQQKWIAIGWAIAAVVCFGIIFIVALLEGPSKNEVEMPCSAYYYQEENYEVVVQELEDLGFTQIETAQKNDLVTGWITKDGSVYKVSIGGDSNFEKGDIFSKDDKVVVTYHTF